MDRPLDIAFHNTEPSPEVEAEIRQHADKLAARYPRLVACRVSVEALHNQHRTGNVFDVHIVLSLPGRDLAVSRAPHHAKDHYAHRTSTPPFAMPSARRNVSCNPPKSRLSRLLKKADG